MKKPYKKPEMEITEFDTEDVITTSNPDGYDPDSEENNGIEGD